eukprot:g23760.t1
MPRISGAQSDPFTFRCPMTIFQRMAAAALVGRKAAGDCCKSYDAVPMLWPYQFPECGRSWCPSCWNSSDVKSLPVHTFAALGYAASLAVSSPKALKPQGTERRLDITRHAGIASNKMLARAKHGFREPPGQHKAASSTANVHEGFYLELQRVLPHVRKWVEGYIEGTKGLFGIPSYWKLVFTGHSLGAALAILAATLAEAEGWARTPDAVVAFGAPRLADQALSDWWESRDLCGKILRVAVQNDVITWMPFVEPLQLMEALKSLVVLSIKDMAHHGSNTSK